MLTALASILLTAQAQVPPDHAALAQCLARFAAAQQQAGTPVADFANALATTCYEEERAYRAAFTASATARGAGFLDADSEAYRIALSLRTAQRDGFLMARPTCSRPGR